MSRKKPEEKHCLFTSYERAVEESVWGIQDGYKVENTLVEMMKRYTNDGLINRENEKLRLSKDILLNFKKKENKYIEELKKCVLELEESVIADADSIRDSSNIFYSHFIDYDDNIRDINNIKYELSSIHNYLKNVENVILELEKQLNN